MILLHKQQKDLTGQQYNKLTITTFSHRAISANGYSRNIWNVVCACGKQFKIGVSDFKKGTGQCWKCGHETARAKITKDPQKLVFDKLFNSYKRTSKKRKKEFNLTKGQFRRFINDFCYYCGTEPRQKAKHPRQKYELLYNGIDRLDSSKGYILNNCVTCCSICNYMKQSLYEEDFYLQLLRILKHRKLI
jgi:hypothetical protein